MDDVSKGSIVIILHRFKEGHITEEEAVRLIEDIYGTKYTYVPIFPQWPQTPIQPQKWEVTYSNDIK